MEQVENPYNIKSWTEYEEGIFDQGSLKQLEADRKKVREVRMGDWSFISEYLCERCLGILKHLHKNAFKQALKKEYYEKD